MAKIGVFISYNHKDKIIVDAVVKSLTSISPDLDVSSIIPVSKAATSTKPKFRDRRAERNATDQRNLCQCGVGGTFVRGKDRAAAGVMGTFIPACSQGTAGLPKHSQNSPLAPCQLAEPRYTFSFSLG
jgi:hypothetical protein